MVSRKRGRRLLSLSLVLIALFDRSLLAQAGNSSRRRPARSERVPSPPCAVIEGTDAVTFTGDDGLYLTPTKDRLRGIVYTRGLATLPAPGVLLAAPNGALLRSVDDGCSWTKIGDVGDVDGSAPFITPAGGNRAYVWADQRNDLFSVDGASVTPLKSPLAAIIGLGVDRTSPDHLRIAGSDGSIQESIDGGVTWKDSAVRGPEAAIFYRARFAENDLGHVVMGTATNGSFVSRDGGAHWLKASGYGTGGENVFELAISPADSRVVWAAAIDIQESDSGAPSGGRHIYLSSDGGASFRSVIDASPAVIIRNGPVLVAHPTNAGVVYFVFGTYFQKYGTDLYRFDADRDLLTTTHNSNDDVDAIAFKRDNPSVLYLGLESVELSQPASRR